jgi:hypothetical protein
MVSVEVYIKVGEEYKRLDLFKDEKISLTSSIQNVNDLSKVFTDYTQSFTVPASKVNNQIFNYWNENAVNDGFDQRVRYDAIIELNTIPFKKGQIQIEKANEKNNRVESFSVTFYGKVKQIKDLFKEDKLSILDYSSLNHPYTYNEVKDRIDGTINNEVCYPLVGNQHKYEYLTGSSYDVTIGGTLNRSIVYTDLFPAIPVSKVFEFIQDRYNITFTSSLFDTSYWTDLYLYCKNIEESANYYAPKKIDFTSKDSDFPDIDLTTDNYTLKYTFADNVTVVDYQKVLLSIYPTVPTIEYKLVMRIGGSPTIPQGTIHQEWNGLYGVQINMLITEVNLADASTGYFWFEIQSNTPITFYTELYSLKYHYSPTFLWENKTAYAITQSTSADISIKNYIPDIKVVDFFNGLIKMFNLTITATTETEFNLEPLEFYYAYGKYIDINSYVINDSVDLERTKLFKKLAFSHEKSENILNNYFRGINQRGFDYGDLNYEDNLSNESNTYEIKTPFENVMWEKATNENFYTTTLVDKDLKPYKSKCILMYTNNVDGDATTLTTPVKLFDGTNYNNLPKYVRFSNELILNGSIASLNFGEEQSSWYLNSLASDSLFNLWYQNYISGLYNIRCRIVKLKAIIPITMLSEIKLNDKIVYKDKKYIINQFTADLTTGEVDFELISDFRAVTNSANGTDRFALKQLFTIDNTAQDLEVTILKLNSEYYDVAYAGTSYESLDNYADGTFIVPIDSNTTGDYAFKQIEITYHNPDLKQYINIIQDA